MDFEMVDGSPNLAADTELTLESWLEALGMSEFLSPFQDQGFDLHLIRAQGLDEEDLAAIGITKRGYIKKLIAAAKALSQAPKAAPRAASGPFSADHSQLPALLDFCTQNMMVTVDHQRACNYLDLAIKFGEEALQGICLDFIERHTLEVMSSEGFLGLSPKGVEIILQSPALNIEEVVLFQALLRWKTGDSAHRDLAPFVKYIRFGAMSAGDLFKIVEPLGVATPEQLLAAYRFHSCPELKAACNTPFFTPRKKTGSGVPSVSGNAAASSVSNVFPIPSKGAAWTLTMSSKYSGLPNTYETLIDEHPNQPGAATNSGQNQWIQATFEQPVIVQKVIVSAPSKGAFELQGWGGPSSAQSYLVGAEVQCSITELIGGEQWWCSPLLLLLLHPSSLSLYLSRHTLIFNPQRCDCDIMAKATRTRRRVHSRRIRARPYKFQSSNRLVTRNVFPEDCSKCIEKRDNWENVICSVCMECPHNAVLLLCSSHDKGCRPYMCGTSFRYSNCLDQYKKASAKLKAAASRPPSNKSELGNLTCPLCRGQVKGWTIVQPARDYLNLKKRTCMQENCVFAGTFKELRKHMKEDHPCAKPREVDPEVEQNWRRLEIEHDQNDVMSTIRSLIPGATVLGDYVIERNNNNDGNGSDSDEGGDHYNGSGMDAGFGRNFLNVILMMHAVEASRNQTRRSDSDSSGTNEMTFSGEEEEDRQSTSLASRMRRQGRVLLGRSGRRRRAREANQRPGPPR